MRKWSYPVLALLLFAGACGSSSDEDPIGEGLGEAATFDEIRAEVFPGCALAGCHGAAAPQADLVLTADDALADEIHAALVDAPVADYPGREEPQVDTLVVPGKPDESFLYWKVLGHEPGNPGNEVVGDPMPSGCGTTTCMAEEQIEMIRSWIAAGAER